MFVPGPRGPAVTVPTLAGDETVGASWAPSFRFGLSGLLFVPLSRRTLVAGSWGVFRDQASCDTCAQGEGPGWLGSELLGSTDLTVTVSHGRQLADDVARLVVQAGAVLPASRDAFACNPFYGAPGAGLSFELPARLSTVSVSVSARRPIYRYQAVPIGLCAPPLEGDAVVEALTGPVGPEPWAGDWYGASNPTLTGLAQLAWTNPHAAFANVPALTSSVALGLQYTRGPAHPEVVVAAQSGDVTVDAASNPVRTQLPWSASVGWLVGDTFAPSLSVSNRLPTLLADPGGTFRAVPVTTSITASLDARF